MYLRKKRKSMRPHASPEAADSNNIMQKKSKINSQMNSENSRPVRRTRSLIAFWRQKCDENGPPCNFTKDCPKHNHHHHQLRQKSVPLQVKSQSSKPKQKNLKPQGKAKLLVKNFCKKVKSSSSEFLVPTLRRAFSHEEHKDYKPKSVVRRAPRPQIQVPAVSPCIIVHNGSYRIKAGLSTGTSPTTDLPSELGQTKYDASGIGRPIRRVYVGSQVDEERRALKLRRPIVRGLVTNWNDMEAIWHHTFDKMQVDTSDFPLLMTESPQTSLKNNDREHILQLGFETFNSPSFYLANQAIMSLYSSGRTTGLVTHIGYDMSYVVPVFEGRTISYATTSLELGGYDLTRHLADLLYRESGHVFNTSADYDSIRDLKHTYGYIAADPEDETSSCTTRHFRLPDGNHIKVGEARFQFCESLFTPETSLGIFSDGLHEMVVKSIEQCDRTLRNRFFSNICLSGGSSLIRGLDERLLKEISMLDPGRPQETIALLDCQKDDKNRARNFSAWTGAAILASHSSFEHTAIPKSVYEEMGPSVVYRWCF